MPEFQLTAPPASQQRGTQLPVPMTNPSHSAQRAKEPSGPAGRKENVLGKQSREASEIGTLGDIVKLKRANADLSQRFDRLLLAFEELKSQTAEATPAWKASTVDYDELSAFAFETPQDLGKALEPFYDKSSHLYRAPTRAVGRNTIFVPAQAVPLLEKYLNEHSIAFHMSKVLSAAEYRKKRRLLSAEVAC